MISICTGDTSNWLTTYRDKQPVYACILSFTDTALIPQISAAGLTPEDRRRTAAADGAFLIRGQTSQTPLVPLSAGISPAIISRAILNALAIPSHLLSTGLPVPLCVPHIELPKVIGNAVDTGHAMSLEQVHALFSAGRHWGQALAPSGSYLILAECVVGGTTTAQAVLSALGYSVEGCMGSSHLAGNHFQKSELVRKGIDAWHQREALSSLQQQAAQRQQAFRIVAAVGDPMQIVAAGMVIGASQKSGVMLAGGSQMLAVYALAGAITQQQKLFWRPEHVVVGTTRWVVEDSQADTVAIAQQLGVPYLASQMSFLQSPYMQLRAYEQGHIKEGVGAGGCAIAAHLYQRWTRSQLRHAVEALVRQM